MSYDIRGTNDSIYRGTKGYNVVFKTGSGAEITGNDQYWLGSSYCYANSYYATWGMYYVNVSDYVDGHYLYNSFGYVSTPRCGVRPVVSLQSDIRLEGITTYEIR